MSVMETSFSGLEGNGDLGGGDVGVDVVRLTEVVHAHRRDDRDVAAVQQVLDRGWGPHG